jgi:hypothetical protein
VRSRINIDDITTSLTQRGALWDHLFPFSPPRLDGRRERDGENAPPCEIRFGLEGGETRARLSHRSTQRLMGFSVPFFVGAWRGGAQFRCSVFATQITSWNPCVLRKLTIKPSFLKRFDLFGFRNTTSCAFTFSSYGINMYCDNMCIFVILSCALRANQHDYQLLSNSKTGRTTTGE